MFSCFRILQKTTKTIPGGIPLDVQTNVRDDLRTTLLCLRATVRAAGKVRIYGYMKFLVVQLLSVRGRKPAMYL